MKIKYIKWRDGRPRFSPGTSMRGAGYIGQDLRHDDGTWFTVEQAQEYSAAIDRMRNPHHEPSSDAALELPPVGAPRPRATNYSGFVYFLRSGSRLKIGFSRNPGGRLTGLRTAMSHRMDTIAVVPGTEREERSLHWQLRAYRRNGEWFECNQRVMEVMIRSLTFGRVMLEDTNGLKIKKG